MKMIKQSVLFCLLLTLLCAGARAEEMVIDAGAAFLYDMDQDMVLFSQNAEERMYPASLVKLMSALLVVEAVASGEVSLEQEITVTPLDLQGLRAADFTLGIRAGDSLTVEELLSCAMIGSSNEACDILATALFGGTEAFVGRMNRRAAQLGCRNTNYTNTHGLHDERQYTTAEDVALLVREALRHDLLRELCATDEYNVRAEQYTGQRFFYSANYLISGKKVPGYTYRYAIGMRTGYTPEAGSCLAAAAVKNGRNLISVVLNAKNGTQEDGSYKLKSFSESKRLLEWGFENFSMHSLIRTTNLLGEVPVTLSRDADYVVIHPAAEIEVMLPNGTDVSVFEKTVTLYEESVRAPVEKGTPLGRLTISHEGKEYGSVELIALTAVERSELLHRVQVLHDFFMKPVVKNGALALLLLIVAGFILVLAHGRKKKRKDSTGRYLSYHRKARRHERHSR